MAARQLASFPPFHLDLLSEELFRGREPLPLRHKNFAVLRYLVERAGEVVAKEELLHAVWLTYPSDTVLKLSIFQLRTLLGDNAEAPQFIETVGRRGYRFVAPIVWRSAAAPSSRSIPLPLIVGREDEVQRLHAALTKARRGERQLVLLSGEPGIGKTTVVETFLAQVAQDPYIWVARGQCVEQYGAGEAYMPVLSAIEHLSRSVGDSTVIDLLHRCAPMWLAQLPSLIDADMRAELQRQCSGAAKERMLREFSLFVELLTTKGVRHDPPLLLLVLEDLHWSDRATVELLALLARRREAARLCVLGAYRPAETATANQALHAELRELYAHRHATELPLSGLTLKAVTEYLEQRFPASIFPEELSETLYRHTEGNPLFLAKLIDDLIAHGALLWAEGSWGLQSTIAEIVTGIPETLRQLLEKQGERLTHADRRLLQAASVAGAEFSTPVVAAALGIDVTEVEERAEALVEQRQFLKRAGVSRWPDGSEAARYAFQHVIHQHFWHERAPIAHRQLWHRRIGERLLAAYGPRAPELAGELAIHFEQGRDYRRAIEFYRQAAATAEHRHAHQEALTHVSTALHLLPTLPDPSERNRQELTLQLTSGALLTAVKGYTAPEVEQAYIRARELCARDDNTPELFSALHGLCRFFAVRADNDTARELGEQLVRLARQQQDAVFLTEAHYALGTVLFYLGHFEEARLHMEQGLAHYDRRSHHLHADLFGQDPGVACHAQLAWILWVLGYPEQAEREGQAAVALAQELAHPFSLAFACHFLTALHQFQRDSQATQQGAEELVAFARAQAFPYWQVMGLMLQGRELARHGKQEPGITQIRQGLAALHTVGTAIARTYWLALLVEATSDSGAYEESNAALAEALAAAATHNEHHWEAELYRLQGELTLRRAQGKTRRVTRSAVGRKKK
ncbi:MAG: AAA family ATPase [Deltaproteobacteria bacterium]|nr:AAA family ATPase [Deltaproteobacteria bacterium]